MIRVLLSAVLAAAMIVTANAQSEEGEIDCGDGREPLAPPAGVGAYSLSSFAIPAEMRLEKEMPRLTVYYPVNSDGAFPGLRADKLNIIVWGNGQKGVKNSCKYVKLFQHWVSHGFVVVAEESSKRFYFSGQFFEYGVNRFSDWARCQRSGAETCAPNDTPDVARNNALSDWLASLDESRRIEYDIIAAGKSRGSVQALSFSRSDRTDLIGVLCISGCSLRFPVPPRTNVNGLFITGDRDWVYGLPAKHMTLWTYNRSTGPKQYFQRSGKDPSYGTHLGHDNDPLIRLLTTDWLRCTAHKDADACFAVLCMRKDSKNGWSDIRRNSIEPDMIALARSANAEAGGVQQCDALSRTQ